MLRHRIGVHALATRPGAVSMGADHLYVRLDPRPRQLDPLDGRMRVERSPEADGIGGIGPHQARGGGRLDDGGATLLDR